MEIIVDNNTDIRIKVSNREESAEGLEDRELEKGPVKEEKKDLIYGQPDDISQLVRRYISMEKVKM